MNKIFVILLLIVSNTLLAQTYPTQKESDFQLNGHTIACACTPIIGMYLGDFVKEYKYNLTHSKSQPVGYWLELNTPEYVTAQIRLDTNLILVEVIYTYEMKDKESRDIQEECGITNFSPGNYLSYCHTSDNRIVVIREYGNSMYGTIHYYFLD